MSCFAASSTPHGVATHERDAHALHDVSDDRRDTADLSIAIGAPGKIPIEELACRAAGNEGHERRAPSGSQVPWARTSTTSSSSHGLAVIRRDDAEI